MVSRSPRPTNFGNLMLARFEELEKKSGIKLEIPQKILLAETGTLEQIISILAQEQIVVKIIEQKEQRGMISRRSLITTTSGRVLVRAESKISVRNNTRRVLRLVRAKKLGIGSIIQTLKLEVFRKILEIGYDPSSRNLFRRYQIYVSGRLCFEIKEEFLGAPLEYRGSGRTG